MKKTVHQLSEKARLQSFGRKLVRLMQDRGWSGADLAREASKFVPPSHQKSGKRYEVGRHIISAYVRGENEPTGANLEYIARALKVEPDDLLPPAKNRGPGYPFVQLVSSLEGKSRLVIDAELDTDLAMKVIALIREGLQDAS